MADQDAVVAEPRGAELEGPPQLGEGIVADAGAAPDIGAAPGAAVPPPPPPPPPPSQRQPQQPLPHRPYLDAGVNFITEVKDRRTQAVVGFEAGCLNPLHRSPTCRKNVRSTARGRDPDLTLRMLKVWLVWGRDAVSRAAHQELWSDVELHARAGQLPEEIEPVQAFPGGFVPRKKARTSAPEA